MPKISKLILGSWVLMESRLFDEDKKPVTDPLAGSSGIIEYSENNRMSVQIVPRDYAKRCAKQELSANDYHAYFGSYFIDENKGIVTHKVEGSNHFAMIGKDLARKVTFFNDNTSLTLCTEPTEDVFGDGKMLYYEAVWQKMS
ncbi:MAG: lipocalin-like domain-containing protein [Gammaproteobacteria bacterium]|nr:lipocalin-like domain-containing protein [Gammaproteobacteria bacterium]